MDLLNEKYMIQEKQKLSKVRNKQARFFYDVMNISMVVSDLLAFFLAWLFSVIFRILIFKIDLVAVKFQPVASVTNFSDFSDFLWILPVLILFFYFRQLYPGSNFGVITELQRLVTTISFVFFVFLTFSFFGKMGQTFSRTIIGSMWFFAVILTPLNRSLVRLLLVRLNLWGEPIVIIGEEEAVNKVSDHLERNKKLGLYPSLNIIVNSSNLNKLTQLAELEKIIQKSQARTLIVAQQEPFISFIEDIDTNLLNVFEKTIFVNTNFFDQMLWVSTNDLGGMMGFEIKKNLGHLPSKLIKRFIDIVGASIGLVVLSPVFFMIMILIILDSEGLPIYHQIRVGKNSKEFKFYKFRTMHKNADEILVRDLMINPSLKQEWEQYQKIKKDPRITKIGKLLRRYSLDELPQLWNVLIGDMSLVGPRPFTVEQLKTYGNSVYNYQLVRPGLTGMWQVSGRNRTTFQKRVLYDNYYVRNWSIWLDIYILIRTFTVVLQKDGAF